MSIVKHYLTFHPLQALEQKNFVKTDQIENRTTDENYFVSQTDGSFFFCIRNMFSFLLHYRQ